jgi:hypothetical protein
MTSTHTDLVEHCRAYALAHPAFPRHMIEIGFILHYYHMAREDGDMEGSQLCDALMEMSGAERLELFRNVVR